MSTLVRRLVYSMCIYSLLNIHPGQAQMVHDAAEFIAAKPGQTITFSVTSTHPKQIHIHPQNMWRYIKDFGCKQNDKISCLCTLTIKHEDHSPVTFSVLEDQKNNRDPLIRAYISIVESNEK